MASLDKIQVDGNSYTIDATTLNGRPASDYLLKSEVYPVGSIYISLNSTNPSSIFGGTWEQIQVRFLLGVSSSHPVNQTGGEESHTLTVNEMPSHTHSLVKDSRLDTVFHINNASFGGASSMSGNGGDWLRWNPGESYSYTGGNQSHNNMPPYIAVYIWKRTA